jgi:drug/metabolite transporter (DMT)-like permease
MSGLATAMRRFGRGDAVAPPAFVLLWSSAFVAAVIGVGAAPPLLLTAARFVVAGVLLALLALVARRRWPRGRQLGHVVVSGLLMQAVQFGALYAAVGAGLPSGVVALVQGLNPAVIALLAVPVLGERIRPRQWWGFAIGSLGVLLAVSDQWAHSAGAVLCAVLGLFGLAAGTVYQKRFVRDMDALSGTSVQFLAGAPVLCAATMLLEHPRVSDWPAFGAALAWIVLVNSVGTFVLLNVMLARGAANRVGSLFFLTPAVTAALSWVVLGSTLRPLELAGLGLGGVGVLLAASRVRASGAGVRVSGAGLQVSGASRSAGCCASSRPAAAAPSALRRYALRGR